MREYFSEKKKAKQLKMKKIEILKPFSIQRSKTIMNHYLVRVRKFHSIDYI